jgi:hypothetical protein
MRGNMHECSFQIGKSISLSLVFLLRCILKAFNFRFPPQHVNPLTNCPQSLSILVEQVLLPKYRDLAKRFAIACAVALEFPETDFFSRHLQGFDLATLRMLHYPPCDWDDSMSQVGNVSQALRINEHTDFGLFVRTYYWYHTQYFRNLVLCE